MRALIPILLLALAVSVLGSSHGEAPETAAHPQTDVTDVYAFRSYETGRDQYVTLVANFNPRENSFGGPNFYPLSTKDYYEIHIDQTGDGIPEITYQFRFINELANNGSGIELTIGTQKQGIALKAAGAIGVNNTGSLNFLEYYNLNVVTPSSTSSATISGTNTTVFQKPWDYAGNKTFSNYSSYAAQYEYNVDLPNCGTPGRVFVGQRHESFVINIGQIFDLVNIVPVDAASGFPGGITQDVTNNVIDFTNIISIILEVPISCVTAGSSSPVIGVYATTRSIRGNRQRSRLGNPLINELLIGLKDKDRWSRRSPGGDRNLLKYILYPTFSAILDLLFRAAVNSALGTNFPTIAPTNFPRLDLSAALLTGIPGVNFLSKGGKRVDVLRLNTSIPVVAPGSQNSLGVIAGDAGGYPNGRRPGDDVIDIVLRVVMGVICHLGLGVCQPSQANTGLAAYTDGAPINASFFATSWPYLNTPNPGSGPYYF